MSKTVATRLRQWGMTAETIQRFEDASITEDLLPVLDESLLRDLLPSAIELVRFKINRRKEFGSKEKSVAESIAKLKIIATADVDGSVTIDDQYVNDTIKNDAIETTAELDGSATPKAKSSAAGILDETVILESRDCWIDSAEIDLEQVIRTTKCGIGIWNLYQATHKLRDSDRDAIAAAIIDHELQFDLNRSISAGRFVYLTKQILKTFPTEAQSVWALIEGNGRFVTGKGKLYSRWSNVRRKYMNLGLIPRSRQGRKRPNITPVGNHGDPSTSENVETEQLKVDTILWLKNNGTPWVTIEKNWSETTAARRQILINEKTEIRDYLKEYPAFKNPRGYMLLEIDFDALYPEKSKAFFASWPILRNFLLQRVPKVCGVSAESITDPVAQSTFLLMNLSLIFRVINVRKLKAAVKEWRPSKSEVQEAFVLHVKVVGDLEVKLEERRKRLARFGCQLQPLVAVVGPSFEEISQSFVIVDADSRFEVETPLRAIDVVFKCIYALDAQYPAEAAHVWQFIQRGVYGIPRHRTDPHFTDVEKLLNDLTNSQDKE